MNKTTGIIIAIVVVVGAIFLLTRSPKSTDTVSTGTEQGSTTTTSGQNNVAGQGRVVYSVTDAAVDIIGISELNLKINRVEIHSNATGWVTVSSSPKTYSLLELRKSKQSILLADANAKAGVYDQVRLTMDSATVKTSAGVVKNAKLPSSTLAINTMLVVNAGTTSTANFDFMADKSLYTTGLGEYIFAPVVKTMTESAVELTLDGKGVVTLASGHVDNTSNVGMDIDGSVKLNFKIDSNQKLQIGANNTIQVDTTLK